MLAMLVAAGLPGIVSASPPRKAAFPTEQFLARLPLTETTAAPIKARCNEAIALAASEQRALEMRRGPATIADFRAYDELELLVGDLGSEMYLISQVSPVKVVREAAETCYNEINAVGTGISLSQASYERLAAIPLPGLDTKTAFALRRVLVEYRLAGVDRDAAARAKLTQLQKDITATGLVFDGNIRDDKGDTPVAPEALKGLPQDWLDHHKPGADHLIHLTHDYPDVLPVLMFADDRATRRRVMTDWLNRGYPANETVLRTLLQQRYQLATILGYPDYAAYVTADKMVSTPQKVAAFLDEINLAVEPGAEAERNELLAYAKTIDPAITEVQPYDRSYLKDKLRKQQYDVDDAEVRKYFTYAKAQTGVLGLASNLFGVEFRPWETPVWDKQVSAWGIYERGELIGHFYLDMHPRDGKYNHEAQFPIRTGVAGRQLPVTALICNFPATGQMDHQDVTTFLHEFGHLLHDIFSGRVAYSTEAMGNLPTDFIEAPSQFLEEWTWDYDTLRRFASDDKGVPITEELVRKMNAGRHFGEPGDWALQIMLAKISLAFYNQKPGFDLDKLDQELWPRYSLYPFLLGSHVYDSFNHLNNYSAIYYTYIWDKAIALDLFGKFKVQGLHNPKISLAYRHDVLDPGASDDPNALVEHFLGRPISTKAFEDDLHIH